MDINFDNDRPIYLQILELMKVDIVSGKYKTGEKLPSVRDLAAYYRVNPNTMQRAFVELESIGLVYTERTNGRFVSEDRMTIADIQKEIASAKVKAFLFYMDSLGLSDEDIIQCLKEERKGEKK